MRRGVAYLLVSDREAVYLVEALRRLPGARGLSVAPSIAARELLILPDQFPTKSKTGWVYDSGNYEAACSGAGDRDYAGCGPTGG